MWPTKRKQKRARDLLLFKYFLNNLRSTVFIQNTLSKLVELLQLKNELIFGKKAVTVLCSSLLEMCVQSLKLIV